MSERVLLQVDYKEVITTCAPHTAQKKVIYSLSVNVTYTTLAIDLGLHGSWQNSYLQRFDYILIIYVANKNFANYREVQDLSPTS